MSGFAQHDAPSAPVQPAAKGPATAVPAEPETPEIGGEASPAWRLYLEARMAYDRGDYGVALARVRKAVDLGWHKPEAEVMLARILQAEGEYLLAEEHFRKALSEAGQLEIPEQRHEIRYQLAEIKRLQKNEKEFSEILSAMIKEHMGPQGAGKSELPEELFRNMLKMLKDSGLDQALLHYRLEQDVYLRAYSELGELLYRNGRYEEAARHLLVASVLGFSAVIRELREIDPGFAFTSVDRTLDRGRFEGHILVFIKENRLLRGLYYLAACLYPINNRPEAIRLWRVVARFDDGEWKTRSLNQLKAPALENVKNR